MKKIRFLCGMLVAVCLLGGCSKISNRSERLEYEKQIDEVLISHGFEGSVLIADGEGIIYEKAFGYIDADEEKVLETTTVYEAGSLTKQFTAAAVIRLESEGLLSLDDTLSKYFPEIKWAYEFSVRDLVNMNTRIPDYRTTIDYTQVTTKEALTNEILAYTLGNEITGYSNSNYYLLGAIIEKVSGVTYEEYIRCNLLEPTGLKHTSISEEDYQSFSAGALHSNIYDMYQWNKAYFGGEIVSEKYLSELRGQESGYLYGLNCEAGSYYHKGQINNHSSYMKYNEEYGIYIILLSNEINQAIDNYGNSVYEITMEYVG